ncbi:MULTISPECIES: phage replisome organizer N-terminal domain-containing protein [unclassified Clostridium]|uniref:phage replisome organizer N-terminal domain-containing protein n=1 Tax=unclassified Clostridium TaxID=2614128 RepID=UPI0002984A0E|nr:MULTISPECIES: phage replisome organizer N-terminal domain-containing protein [unclassified Clostridium]EKQ56208.1 MAG: DnaD-like protein,putative phage replisome organizer [Clostridium sp. Maddingley MBC34-26]
MGDVKWVKFEVGMYDDTKLKILDDMENRDLYHYVWTRSLVLAGKINRGGYLYITDNMPYTIKTLAIEFNRSVDEIKAAYKMLRKLEMIELTEDKAFRIKNWEKHQNVEGMERARQLSNNRVAKCRAKKKELNEKNKENEINNDVSVIIEENTENSSEKINNADIQEDSNTSNVTENITCNKTNDKSSVTCNGDSSYCNVTVMEQNKKENKTKKEKKKESKSDIKNTHEDDNSLSDLSKAKETSGNKEVAISSNFSTDESKEDFKNDKVPEKNKACDFENDNSNNQNATDLLKHYENITGILGGLNIGLLKLAVEMHGYKNVKMAINKALEVNKANMTYINGILKNWKREGYPEDDMEVKINGFRSTGKSNTADKNEFAGFKPKEPRKLTEAERKSIEAKLI